MLPSCSRGGGCTPFLPGGEASFLLQHVSMSETARGSRHMPARGGMGQSPWQVYKDRRLGATPSCPCHCMTTSPPPDQGKAEADR